MICEIQSKDKQTKSSYNKVGDKYVKCGQVKSQEAKIEIGDNKHYLKLDIGNWIFDIFASFLSRTPGSRRKSIIVRRNRHFYLDTFQIENNSKG